MACHTTRCLGARTVRGRWPRTRLLECAGQRCTARWRCAWWRGGRQRWIRAAGGGEQRSWPRARDIPGVACWPSPGHCSRVWSSVPPEPAPKRGRPPRISTPPHRKSARSRHDPRDELRALFREVAATPLPASLDAGSTPAAPPAGTPADAQTVAEITATWRQYLACLSAGDQARMFALLSEAMVRRQFVVDIAFGVTEEALFSFLAATPSRSLRTRPSHSYPSRMCACSMTVASRWWDPAIRAGGTSASSSRRATAGCSMTGSI